MTPAAQMRHAAICVWPSLASNRAADISRIRDQLGLLGYRGGAFGMSADEIIEGWQEAGWIELSPDGFQMRLTVKANEQLALWQEDDRLWRTGEKQEVEMPKRLVAGEPAKNLRRIHAVIGSRTVACIHDPYLDVKALVNLLKLDELGTQFDGRLRLLGAASTAKLITVAQFLRDDINIEKNTQWEMRTYTTPQRPHRRFLVCADGTVVTCGLSMNNLNKDEALDLILAGDERAEHDSEFFDKKWKLGRPV